MSTPAHVERAVDSVLGTLLNYYTPELVHQVQAAGLRPDDLNTDRSRILYRAILALHRDGSHVDPLTVEAFLHRHGLTDRCTRAYMELLAVSAVPSAVREHARMVAEEGAWVRRHRALEGALEALLARDEARFWDEIGRVREDVSGVELRVVNGEAA